MRFRWVFMSLLLAMSSSFQTTGPLRTAPIRPQRLSMNAGDASKPWRYNLKKAPKKAMAPESPAAAYPSIDLDADTVSFIKEEAVPEKPAKKDVTDTIAAAVVAMSSAADALSPSINKVKEFAPIEKVKSAVDAVKAFDDENEVLLKARAVAELGFGALTGFASTLKATPASKPKKAPAVGKESAPSKTTTAPKHKKVRKTFF